jgi:hypothetical protein
LEQVPGGHDTFVHVPPEQFPLPVIRPSPAEAAVVKITELKTTNDSRLAKTLIPVSSTS